MLCDGHEQARVQTAHTILVVHDVSVASQEVSRYGARAWLRGESRVTDPYCQDPATATSGLRSQQTHKCAVAGAHLQGVWLTLYSRHIHGITTRRHITP